MRGASHSGTTVADNDRVSVRRYQDLIAWQLANKLKQKVYALIDQSPARRDLKFCDQIRESASSGPTNIAEGFGCYRHTEFARYTRIARSSLIETHNHLGDGIDRGYWSERDVQPLLDFADRATGATTRLMQYLMSTEAPASRFQRSAKHRT